MGRGKKPLLESVEIKKIAAEGKSIAYIDEKILFVPNTVPGDVVDVQVTRKRKSFLEGFVVKTHRLSELRVTPFCPHFGICGGCKWQNLPYDMQLKFKQQEIIDNLERIGKVKLQNVYPIIGSARTTHYRNKLEFTFSNKRFLTKEEISEGGDIERSPALGFHVPGLFDKVVDIQTCFLQAAPSDEIRNFIKEYALKNKLAFFDIRNQEGFLRTLIIRTSSTGEIMVVLAFFHEDRQAREALLDALYRQFPQITSLLYVINEKANDTLTDQIGRAHV